MQQLIIFSSVSANCEINTRQQWRPIFYPTGIITKRYDADFKKYHQLMLSILKEFGFGAQHLMEARIVAELEPLVGQLKQLNGKPVNPKPLLYLPLLNVISGILFAHRFDCIDDNLQAVVQVLGEFLVQLDPVLDIAPSLRFLPRYRSIGPSLGRNLHQ